MRNKINWRVVLVVSILLGLLAGPGHAEQYETKNIPWSGYWWPYNQCGLASGNGYFNSPSPLEKYEQYTLGYYPGALTQWYKQTYCGKDYPSWYGHCGHWAFAASWENYDILPSVIDNIIFRVGDKKGLLTLAHNDNNAVWGSAVEASEFHYWLLRYIRDAGRAFVADMDGGSEVWQYPLYKYEMTSKVDGSIESVDVKVYGASDFVDPDYIGTKDIMYRLTYDLYLDGNGDITGGAWTGSAADGDHPQKMHYLLSPNSDAQGLDYDQVVKIAKTKDDEYENGETAAALPPGTYNLILMDADVYELDAGQGDVLTLEIGILEGGGDTLTAVLTDKDGAVVNTFSLTSETGDDLKVTADNPPYTLRVYKEAYTTPGIYTLVYDLFKDDSMTCPYVPANGNWSGFSIVNDSDRPLTRLGITGYTEDGQPLQTLMTPGDMVAGEKRRFLFSSLPYRIHELSKINALRISADAPVSAVNLLGTESAVTAVTRSGYTGSRLVLPDSVMEMQKNKNMFGSVINESTLDADVTLTLYTAAGQSVKSVDVSLSPRQAYQFSTGTSPFYSVPESGWMDISAKSGTSTLSGYQYILREGEVEINQAVPVSSDTGIVPHIPNAADWETTLVLINTGSSQAQVVLHRMMAGTDTGSDVSLSIGAKAKAELQLDALFATTPGHGFYRSILSVSSDQALAGFYAYKARSQDDNITIPLMGSGDFSPTLLLPHNTQSSDWWTGIGLLNPNADQASVFIKPYGPDGQVMSNLVHTVSLQSGEYKVYNLKQMFGTVVGEIAFIRFEEKTGQSIGGFYLIDSQSKGICGGNLQNIEE